jgi:hypothetical protein
MVSLLNNLFSDIAVNKRDEKPLSPSDTALLFSQGIKQGLGIDMPPSPANDPSLKLFDSQAVVDNVAGFIEQRINERRTEGATQDELDTLVFQARKGVARGFQLARDDINNAGLLSDGLSKNIDKTEQGIFRRIDELEVTLQNPDNVQISLPYVGSYTDVRSAERSSARFEFELTTQEGDRIQISAQELKQSDTRFNTIRADGLVFERMNTRSSSANSFAISIEGNLNEKERAALDDLLLRIKDISDSFFSDKVDEAFKQALSLSFDSAQIAQFSLDLSTSSLSVTERKDTLTPQQTKFIPEAYQSAQLPIGLQSILSDYANRVEKLLESTEAFSNMLELSEPREMLAQRLQKSFDRSVDRGDTQASVLDAFLTALKRA